MKQPNFQKSLIAVAVTTFLATPAALAQQNDNATADDSKLERIEVTARRTTESLQEVPVSVSAFGEKELEQGELKTLLSFSSKCRTPLFR